MNAKTTLIAAPILALAICLPASAGGPRDNSVDFTFNPKASAAETYANLEDRARKACMSQTYGVRGLIRSELRRRCEADLMDRVVTELNKPDIVALHEAETGRAMDTVSLAKGDTEPFPPAL